MEFIYAIVQRYNYHPAIMQNCLLSVYYFSHLAIFQYMNEEVIIILENFANVNQHNMVIPQRLIKIRERYYASSQ